MIDSIRTINFYNYHYKTQDDSEKLNYGIIAQEFNECQHKKILIN